ncbi:MAG: hypothetical protein ACXW6J_15520 [Candidatus Binatia bacterium]
MIRVNDNPPQLGTQCAIGCSPETHRSPCSATAKTPAAPTPCADIPKADVNPIMRRKDGVKYLEMWNPNWMNMKPVEELINQVMSEDKKD